MKIQDYLILKEAELKQAKIDTYRLDSLVILANLLNKDKAWILAHPDFNLSSAITLKLNKLFTRRKNHEPIAYLFNKIEFYGRDFYINKNALIPRPETEAMIDELKHLFKDDKSTISINVADIGCGSGVIGITAKLELPFLNVSLIDLDKNALKVAKSNVDLFTLLIDTVNDDLTNVVYSDFDIILANLPYVSDQLEINKDAKHEPKAAIYAGKTGLELYRLMFVVLNEYTKRPLYLLIEAFPFQHSLLAGLAAKSNYKRVKSNHFIQVFVDNCKYKT